MRVCRQWGWQNLEPSEQKAHIRNCVSSLLRLRQSAGTLLACRAVLLLNYTEYLKNNIFKLQI